VQAGLSHLLKLLICQLLYTDGALLVIGGDGYLHGDFG
jgi:hypothetical protein